MTIQQQFEYLKKIRYETLYNNNEIVDNKIIKTFYYRGIGDDKDSVLEEQYEFYLDKNNITEKFTTRKSEIAIFSKDVFVLPEECYFNDPIKEEYKYHDNAVKLAYRFGQESVNKKNTLRQVKWQSLPTIVKKIEYILLHGGGYRIAIRQSDTAFVTFQDESYTIIHSQKGYELSKQYLKQNTGRVDIGIYKTAIDLVLSVGIHKFQFDISDNGGA